MVSVKDMRAAAHKLRAIHPRDPSGEAGDIWMAAFSAVRALLPERHLEEFASEAGVKIVTAARVANKDA